MSAVLRRVQAENLDSTETMDKFILGLTVKKKYRKFLSRALKRNADLFPQVANFFGTQLYKSLKEKISGWRYLEQLDRSATVSFQAFEVL